MLQIKLQFSANIHAGTDTSVTDIGLLMYRLAAVSGF